MKTLKTLFKPLLAVVLATVTFTSCMDDNTEENEAQWLQEEKAIDSLLTAEKTKIEEYMDTHQPELEDGMWQKDTVKFDLPRLGKSPERGIWFEVLAEPTEEDNEAYTYTMNNYGVIPPKVKVKYTVSLLNDKEVRNKEGDYDFATSKQNSEVFNQAWEFAFYPATVSYNETSYPMFGLTKEGLKKGSKIRIITPSLWAFGSRNIEDIPANSPLVYTFEVLSIQE